MNSHDSASLEADFFTFDYELIDDPDDGSRFTRYWDLEPLMRGPQPVPDWLVTDRAAIETELGILKTGKEADVFLLERAVAGEGGCVLAAKRYRDADHRAFRRNDSYTAGRKTRNTRDTRAMAKNSTFGRAIAAGQWAWAEWESLQRCWEAGVPVPYPVQIDGTEILMELITDDGAPAPRLATTRPEPDLLVEWFDQLRRAMTALAERGLAHGDLSPYNVLAAGERLVIIDLPQIVDIVANPQGAEFLMRDCHNICTWFARRGLAVDEDELFGSLLAACW
ncbi:serine protein kinase RIO [Nocardioides marmorisolisilvae]|uniref:non-specific serine/threonine protein kinase n=1 Tax=Nocardioides marmorisolisilvae TaxID=1542737 RepID=A0A3N0DW22_9ACTN|nr:RIO1 family regulatory kinase/ATPase [Nocardioides marmorisolisilvae]RNL79819.1 serine/threonine protein kinase [Nocardioides marmorisolisilvae]